jgi:hypothetical protein
LLPVASARAHGAGEQPTKRKAAKKPINGRTIVRPFLIY